MDEKKDLIRRDDLPKRDWQAELPFLDWKANGDLPLDVDSDGEIAYPLKAGVKLTTELSQQTKGGLLPLSAPALREYAAFQQGKLNKSFAEVRATIQEIHDYISDPDNEQPVPLHILRNRPSMAAWLNGENPRHAPTVMESKVIYPAFLERRRKIRERGLAGYDNLSAMFSLLEEKLNARSHEEKQDGPCGQNQWRHNGEVAEGTMQVGAWKMVKYLWNQPDQIASFDELIVPVYGDPEHIADDNAFGALRKAANKFFKAHEIPLAVSLSKTTVSLQSRK